MDALGQTPLFLAEKNCHYACYKLLTTAKSSQEADDASLPQRCSSDVTTNGVTSRVNYMYTSAI